MKVLSLVYAMICTNLIYGFNGFTNLYNTHSEPFVDSDAYYKSAHVSTVKEKFINQKLDHFDENLERFWNMRYLENDRFYVPGGPIFIFVGGEWEISPGLVSGGLMFEIAEELNGTLYYTEHRYYGKSRPTNDTSAENLQYLTVEQALADLAHFIEEIKSSSDELKDAGVILVGASYSAAIAAWARLKYKNLVTGAWASSAPIYAKVDFFEYNEVMTKSIRKVGGEECVEKFASAFEQLEELVGPTSLEPVSLAKIQQDFNLCTPLDLNRDISHFFYEMVDTVAGLVQTHKTGDIENACTVMLDNVTYSDEVAAFGAWVNNRKKRKCLKMNYDATVKGFNNVTWGSVANKQLRQWTYQTCDRFGWFQTSNSKNQAFGTKFPYVRYFTNMCRDLFGSQFDYLTITKNVEKTNEMFGGLKPNLTNVYFTQGEIDPWKAMGLQDDLNDDTPVEVIESYSHTADLLKISETDTQQMKASKLRVKQLVKQWLKLN